MPLVATAWLHKRFIPVAGISDDLLQIGARAPDFKRSLDVHYPNPTGASKMYAIPVSAGWKDAKTVKELFVVIDVVSAEVIYRYRRP